MSKWWPRGADYIEADAPRARDELSQTFIENNDLRLKLALLRLAVTTLLTRRKINGIESLHASTRRFLLLLGTQTHRVDMEELSARWIPMRARKRDEHLVSVRAMPQSADASSSAEAGAATDRTTQHGGGEAGREFTSMSDVGEVRNWSRLSERYHALTVEERQWFETVGVAATQKHRANPRKSPVGPNKKQLDATSAKRDLRQ